MNLIEKEKAEIDYGSWIYYDIDLDGTVIGSISINEYDDGAYIERMDIDERYRNQGHGTKAVEVIAAMYDDIYAAPDNESAKRFWSRLGQEVSSDNDYSYLDQGYGVYKM